MNSVKLSDDLRRFIQAITSVPHLEAILLLHQSPMQLWDETTIALRLYLKPEQAANMLEDLRVAGICKAAASQPGKFIYAPVTEELGHLLDQLAGYYSRNLIEVTNMIHSKANSGRRAQQFADAFKFKKDP